MPYAKLLFTISIATLPGSAYFLQKHYKKAGCYVLTLFFAFSLPAWLRLWANPIGFFYSLAGIGLIWVWYVYSLFFNIRDINLSNYYFSLLRLFSWLSLYLFLSIFCLMQSRILWGYQLFHIPSESMTPTLLPGDFVMVDTWFYIFNPITKRDVVVFKKPFQSNLRYHIKRVGYIHGDSFHEKKLSGDELAVLGDNIDNSEDSRFFGAINRKDVVGKAIWIFTSMDENGSFRLYRTGLQL